MHRPERTVSVLTITVWVLWGVAIGICLSGSCVVLLKGHHIWARAVGLALFGFEILIAGAAVVLTVWLMMRRSVRSVNERIELQEDVRKRVSRMR